MKKEKIYLGKRRTHCGYDMAHLIFENNTFSEQLNFITTMNYYDLCLYLRGACLGKDSKELTFYNGIPDDVKKKYTTYSLEKARIRHLKKKHLESIFSFSGIKEKFLEGVIHRST